MVRLRFPLWTRVAAATLAAGLTVAGAAAMAPTGRTMRVIERQAAQPPQECFQEKRLGTIDEEMLRSDERGDKLHVMFHRHGRWAATLILYAGEVQDSQYVPCYTVILDGRVFKGCTSLPVENPQTGELVLSARDGKRSFLLAGMKEGPGFDHVGRPEFSSDGRWCAYEASQGNRNFVVVNGREIGDCIDLPTTRWSEKWKGFVFQGRGNRTVYQPETGKTFFIPSGGAFDGRRIAHVRDGRLFVDGKETAAHRRIEMPVLGPDGNSIAYVATEDNARWFVVLNGKKQADYDWIDRPGFTSDGLLYYKARDKNRFRLIVGNTVSDEYRNVSHLSFSKNEKVLAYAADGRAVIKGKKGPSFKSIQKLILNDDGSRFAYSAVEENGKETLVVDGSVTAKGVDQIEELAWSFDGKTLICSVRQGSQRCRWVGDYKGKPYDRLGWVQFGPGGRFAYSAFLNNQERFVTADEETAAFDRVCNPAYSPDGKHMAFVAFTGDKAKIVVDGKVGGDSFDAVGGLLFSNDGSKIAFGVRQGNELNWVTRSVGR